MSLFGRNPNEEYYSGGRKHWTDVIKNSGPGELMIWRQPEEDFNTNSTLIVMPGEQAIFIKGGNVEQVFENGTYRLSTENYPFISRLRNAFSGGISTFNCVVYFVRRADSQEIIWGTDSPIQIRDRVWGVRTEAKVRGAYKVRIENPAKFLEKLVGNNIQYQTQDELKKYFMNEFQGKIKSAVSRYLNSLEQELIGIDAYIDELSEQIQPRIDEIVQEYGLRCVRFSLSGLDVDTSKYDAIDESQIAAIGKANLARGDRSYMDIMGEDWGRQQAANILGDLARNPGAGGVGAMGTGMGMGMAAGSVFGNMANQMFEPMHKQQQPTNNAAYQAPVQNSRFAPKNNTAAADPSGSQGTSEDPIEVLGKLKKMLDAGLIEQAEYDAKKAEILKRM